MIKITFTENNLLTSTYERVTEVEQRIIFLKAIRNEPGFQHQDELVTLQCWLYNRHRGPGRMELTKEAFQ
jgi:hypothetical protein